MAMSEAAAYGHGSQRQEPAGRPATELESLIAQVTAQLDGAQVALHEIRRRVMPPKGEPQTTDRVSRVATTYADRVRDLIETAAEINEIATELNGRI